MSSKIPSSLKWLIDKRARIDAEIRKTKKSIKVAEELLNELSQLEETLAAVDKTLELHEIKLDISLIAPVRSKYVRINLPHGELTRSVLMCLRVRGQERPVGSHEITDFIEARHADLTAEPGSRVRLTRSIHKCLDRLYRNGLLVRHHNPKTSTEGLWSLIQE